MGICERIKSYFPYCGVLFVGVFTVAILLFIHTVFSYYFTQCNNEISNYYCHFLVLTYSCPSIFSMYFSNFAHALCSLHIIYNVVLFAFVLFFIIVLHKTLNKNDIINEKPKILAYKLLLLIFILLPFPVAGLSILIGEFVGFKSCIGFSGIATGMIGYVIYIIVAAFISERKSMDKGLQCLILFSLIPIILFVIYVVGFIGNIDTNWPGHYAGLGLGFLFPFLLDNAINSKRNEIGSSFISDPAINYILIISIWLITSLAWIIR